jgi:hypothetical protein
VVSGVDVVYDRNIAEDKLKAGTKYERLAALVFKVLNTKDHVAHDLRLRGDGKRTVHQIDVTIESEGRRGHVLVECRDYESDKIDQDQVRAFFGAVSQLQPATGVMLTTVGYTKGALTFAEDENILLAKLRTFEDSDWDGRVRKIQLTTRLSHAGEPEVSWLFADIPAAQLAQGQMLDREVVDPSVATYYDADGSPAGTLNELIAPWYEAVQKRVPLDGTPELLGREEFDSPIWIKVGEHLLEVQGFRWRVAIHTAESTTSIGTGKAIAELVLSTVDGSWDRVITDLQLREWTFGEAGVVTPRT